MKTNYSSKFSKHQVPTRWAVPVVAIVAGVAGAAVATLFLHAGAPAAVVASAASAAEAVAAVALASCQVRRPSQQRNCVFLLMKVSATWPVAQPLNMHNTLNTEALVLDTLYPTTHTHTTDNKEDSPLQATAA